MTPEESNLILGLFHRLGGANSGPRDAQAEQLIQTQAAALPGAAYMLVQTVLVQEQALKSAQTRIGQLQNQLASAPSAAAPPQSGGFLSGLLHPRAAAPQAPPPMPAAPVAPATPAYAAPAYAAGPAAAAAGGGGGFLKGALTTAAGVAGGALLFKGIEDLLGHNSGPFGSAMGGGGFGGLGGMGGHPQETVVNNYYGSDPASGQSSSFMPPDDTANVNAEADSGTDFTDDATQDQDQDQQNQDQPDQTQDQDQDQDQQDDSRYDNTTDDSGGSDDSSGGGDYA